MKILVPPYSIKIIFHYILCKFFIIKYANLGLLTVIVMNHSTELNKYLFLPFQKFIYLTKYNKIVFS